jgi:hypothetical protein
MGQLVKSTKDFEIFGEQPWYRQGEHQKVQQPSVILARCAILGPATDVFTFKSGRPRDARGTFQQA